MKNTTETLSYIPPFSYQVVREEIGKHNDKLETIRKTLIIHGEGLSEAIEYQKKGAGWKRKQVLAECEEWMNATKCPEYLREDNRKRAYESCDNEYIAKVASALYGLKLNLSTDVEITPEGEWQVAQRIADDMLESHRYTLTPQEVEAFQLYQELLSIAQKLHERNYFITAEFVGEDCLYHLDNEQEEMEHFLSYYRSPER